MNYQISDRKSERIYVPTQSTLSHLIFLLLRVLITCFLIQESSAMFYSKGNYYSGAEDFILISLFSIFTTYIVFKAIVSGNIYGFDLAIFFMIHNFVLISVYGMGVPESLEGNVKMLYLIIGGTFLAESIYFIFLRFIKRHEINYSLFKRIGADPRINDAFAIRSILHTLSCVNLFIPAVMFFKNLHYYSNCFDFFCFLSVGYTVINFISQFLISLRPNEENSYQRKLALALWAIKIMYGVTMKIAQMIFDFCGYYSHKNIEYILSTDILLMSGLTMYFMYIDYLLFGSGLKKHLRRSYKKRLSLSLD